MISEWTYKTLNFTVHYAEEEVGFVDPMAHAPIVLEALSSGQCIITRGTARVLWRGVEIGMASVGNCIHPFSQTRIDPETGLTDDDDPQDHGRNLRIDRSYLRKVVLLAIADAKACIAELGGMPAIAAS